jgi:hypothetical protein
MLSLLKFNGILCILVIIWRSPSIQCEQNDRHRPSSSIDQDVELVCSGQEGSMRKSCFRTLEPALALRRALESENSAPKDWRFDKTCGCHLPPRQALTVIQYLHIPKTGTSINWFLHDYYGHFCHKPNSTLLTSNFGPEEDGTLPVPPCPRWLSSPEEANKGLCGGRLFSCAGHRVHPHLPQAALEGTAGALLTFVRHPWDRVQSLFHHLKVTTSLWSLLSPLVFTDNPNLQRPSASPIAMCMSSMRSAGLNFKSHSTFSLST